MNEPGLSTPRPQKSALATAPGDCPVPGIILVETKSGTAKLTSEARRMLGLPSNEHLPLALDSLPAPLLDLVNEVVSAGAAAGSRRFELTVGNGENVTLSAHAARVAPGASGSPVVLSLSELSWTGPSQERMRRLDRLANAGTLATSMAHEIKNALVASRTFIDLLLEKHPDAELAEVVRRELGRIDAMLGRMLKFAGPSPAALGRVHVHEVLEHSLRLVQPQVAEKNIALQRSFGAPTDLTDGDEYELEQAFVNLFLNALEAMGPHGTLTVSTENVEAEDAPAKLHEEAGPSRIRIAIGDNGRGIPAEHMDCLFEPFFTTKPSGTGLGLAVTHRVIREHRGTIRAESRPGEGTTFTITLPRVTEGR